SPHDQGDDDQPGDDPAEEGSFADLFAEVVVLLTLAGAGPQGLGVLVSGLAVLVSAHGLQGHGVGGDVPVAVARLGVAGRRGLGVAPGRGAAGITMDGADADAGGGLDLAFEHVAVDDCDIFGPAPGQGQADELPAGLVGVGPLGEPAGDVVEVVEAGQPV